MNRSYSPEYFRRQLVPEDLYIEEMKVFKSFYVRVSAEATVPQKLARYRILPHVVYSSK